MSRRQSTPPAGLSVEEHSRLDTWLVEIAAEGRSTIVEATPYGYRIGAHGSLSVRKDGFFCDFEGGGHGGWGAIAFLFAAVQLGLSWLTAHEGFGRLGAGDDEGEENPKEDTIRQAVIETMRRESARGKGISRLELYLFDERKVTTIADEDWGNLLFLEHARGNESALLVPMTDNDGKLVALQQTFLTARGQKSPHEPQRITRRGPADWTQRGLLRFGDQSARKAFICEGTEDGLTVRMAGSDLALVTLGVGNLGLAKLPPSVKEVVVVRHPERPGAPGDKALWAGVVRLLAQSLTVSVTPRAPTVFPPTATNRMKDVNDVLKAHGVDGVKAVLDGAKSVTLLKEEIDTDAVVDTASRLPAGGYEHARVTLAKVLDWRVGALDKERNKRIKERAKEAAADKTTIDPNDKRRIALPHAEPQTLAAILDDIKALILRHVHIEEWVVDLLAIFAAYTHVYQLFDFAVRIRFHSVNPESGKTTTMMLTLRCCQCNRRSDDITAANLSRAFHKPGGCTFGIDEDTSIESRELVLSIVRAGFDRDSQRDLMDKNAEGNLVEASFNLCGPVLLTGIKPLEPMLQTRCVTIDMQPPLPANIDGCEKKKPKVRKRANRLCQEYASRLARWALDEHEHLQGIIAEVEEAGENEIETDIIPSFVDNRTEDKLTPLFIVAHAAGREWHQRMIDAARKLSPAKTREDLQPSIQLLLDIKDLIARDQRVGWTTDELRQQLIAGEDGTSDTTWSDMPGRDGLPSGRVLSPMQLVGMLRAYRIKKRRPRDPHADPDAARAPRRFMREDFAPVFGRYLTPGRVGTAEDLDGDSGPTFEPAPEPAPKTARRRKSDPPGETGEEL